MDLNEIIADLINNDKEIKQVLKAKIKQAIGNIDLSTVQAELEEIIKKDLKLTLENILNDNDEYYRFIEDGVVEQVKSKVKISLRGADNA